MIDSNNFTTRDYPAYKYEPYYPYPEQNNASYLQSKKDKELEEKFKRCLFYFWYHIICCGGCEESVSAKSHTTTSYETKHNKDSQQQETSDMESSDIISYNHSIPSKGSSSSNGKMSMKSLLEHDDMSSSSCLLLKVVKNLDVTQHSDTTTKISNVSNVSTTISKNEDNHPKNDVENNTTQKISKYNPRSQNPSNTTTLGMTRKNPQKSQKIPIPKQFIPMNLKLLCFAKIRHGLRPTKLLQASPNNYYSKKEKTSGASVLKHRIVRKPKVMPSLEEI